MHSKVFSKKIVVVLCLFLATVLLITVILTDVFLFRYPNEQDLKKGDLNVCKWISGHSLIGMNPRRECFIEVIKNSPSIDICKSQILLKEKEFGLEDCLSVVAMHTGDVTLCGQINPSSGASVHCYTDVAMIRNEPFLCGEIKFSDSAINNCYSNFFADFGDQVCDGIGDDNEIMREDCYKNYVEYLFNNEFESFVITPEYCKRYFNKRYLSSCYYKVAVRSKNPKICDEIQTHETYKIECRKESGQIAR